MKYQYLFIDNDDTLMDFSGSEYECIGKTLEHFGLDASHETRMTYNAINKSCWEAFDKGEIKREEIKPMRFTKLLKHLGASHTAEDIDRFGEFYENSLGESAIWLEGAVDFLKNARKHLKIYIVTNGAAKIQRNRFKLVDMDDLVDGIVISEEIGSRKPETEYFETAFKMAGCTDKSKAIMVGDTLTSDIQGGLAAGVDTCLYDYRHNYDHIDSGAKFVAHSYEELNKILFG